MNYSTMVLESFSVIGIAVKTTNEGGKAQKDIGELWQRFMSNGMAGNIPNKAGEDIYCLYTDYESDANGPYITLLGCKVNSLENIPEGFVGKTIPKAAFQLYTSTGKLPESVLATWDHIWRTPINRRYLADFDVYGQKSQDPNNTEVETYVSVL